MSITENTVEERGRGLCWNEKSQKLIDIVTSLCSYQYVGNVTNADMNIQKAGIQLV